MRFKPTIQSRISLRAASCGGALALLLTQGHAAAASLQWAGRSWNVTNGGMAGVAAGSPSNVSVDSNGYLHLKIAKSGTTWTAAEIFSTDKLGFGTYQWQVDGPIDKFDQNVVLGLFPYGPAAGIGQDGTNEIDIEYSFWGHPTGVNGDWTDYPNSGTTIGEMSYKFSLNGGTFSTSRFIWGSPSIQNFLMSGFQAVGSTTGLINSWTYSPPNPTTNIPQQAMPLGINLWCFQAPPSDGQNVEVVIRDFQFVAEGTDPGGAGGTGAGGGTNSGGTNSGGTNGGGATGSGGAAHAGSGGTGGGGASSGGATGSSGASSLGGSPGVGNAGAASAGETGTGLGGAVNGSGGSTGTGGATSTGAASTTSTGTGAASGGSNATGAGDSAPDNSEQSGSCSFGPAPAPRNGAMLLALPLLVLRRRLRRRKASART